jgi:hypothetical protein
MFLIVTDLHFRYHCCVADIHARVDDALLEAAGEALGLPGDASGPRIVRASLATVADWPPAAVALVARVRGGDRAEAEGQAG